ncbi:class I SAM-dependent methyltransferase [Actinocorallia longicatena]|uniref:Methyltransferase type 11 domain-containing protein n=1 Tax=Actinocorallia longicatena TaxID=111803 RepID=A0ABP6Q1W0_9ACTN
MTELSVRNRPVLEGDLFAARVRMHAQDKGLTRVAILEAGCGRGPGLALPDDLDRHVTGIDVDTPALRAHTLDRTDLHSWHLGDLRNAPLPPRAFDVVHADSLIERITNAELVLDRMVAALKPGGLLLIRFTDRDSAYGLIRRLLPRWLRALLGDPVHSTPPTTFEPVTSLDGIRTWCLMRGLVIAEAHTTRPPRSTPVAATARLTAALTGGRYTAAHSDIVLVVRKPENRFARII